jgi:hypothetical protein
MMTQQQAHQALLVQQQQQQDRRDPGIGFNITLGTDSPRLPFPLRSPSLLESAVFYRQNNTSILSTSWSPVLMCLSAAGYLHLFDIDPKGETSNDTAAFSNAAERSKKGVELDIFTVEDSGPSDSVKSTIPFIHQSLNLILESEHFMVPLASLSVPRCTVQFTPTAKDTVFEIIENVPNSGVGSLFRSTIERR